MEGSPSKLIQMNTGSGAYAWSLEMFLGSEIRASSIRWYLPCRFVLEHFSMAGWMRGLERRDWTLANERLGETALSLGTSRTPVPKLDQGGQCDIYVYTGIEWFGSSAGGGCRGCAFMKQRTTNSNRVERMGSEGWNSFSHKYRERDEHNTCLHVRTHWSFLSW